MVELVNPFQGGELNPLEAPPWSPSINGLGLVKTVDRFCEGVVVTVANASDRRFNTCFCQPLE